jgi:cephalosporin hydroxylase
MSAFEDEVAQRLAANRANTRLNQAAMAFTLESTVPKYSYNFAWLGRPIIQYPQDIVAMQEIIWRIQPDLIIETGIAHGGSLLFYASMLELVAATGGPSDGMVVGIDIDIRAHNRVAIESHPMARRVTMIEGSSVADEVITTLRGIANGRERVLVCLDSNHTKAHVLSELELLAPLTSVGSYCVVFDTIVEHLPADTYADRPWGPGNSPKAAVAAFLQGNPGFVVDEDIDAKLLISMAPGGYLKRIA